jgi:hypothetical protein
METMTAQEAVPPLDDLSVVELEPRLELTAYGPCSYTPYTDSCNACWVDGQFGWFCSN